MWEYGNDCTLGVAQSTIGVSVSSQAQSLLFLAPGSTSADSDHISSLVSNCPGQLYNTLV